MFFFLVGLEIKREIVGGELASARKAVLPVVAAVGGMIVPAAIFSLLNAGGPGRAGWAIRYGCSSPPSRSRTIWARGGSRGR